MEGDEGAGGVRGVCVYVCVYVWLFEGKGDGDVGRDGCMRERGI